MDKTPPGLNDAPGTHQDPTNPLSTKDVHHHLKALEAILEADYLQAPNLAAAMADLAGRAQDALNAREAIVALWDGTKGHWSGIGRWGTHLDKCAISERASLSILEGVRHSQAPILLTEEEGLEDLDFDSNSLHLNQVDSIIAVPLWWWNLSASTTGRTLRGVLYAHRTLGELPFTHADVRLLSNIARLAQPILGLLNHLQSLETSLSAKEEEVRGLKAALHTQGDANPLETKEPSYAQEVILPLKRLSAAPKVNILLTGPSGAGKTHLARAFHGCSSRKDAPFIVLDCAQITSAETLGAELFGYAPASGYANAPPEGRQGKARLAHGGLLFIDEIACLDITLQHRLLRLIDQGSFTPLGSSEEIAVDIQIIAATNADLELEVKAGRFREDLYWRLREVTITLPPLHQRRADIPHLAQAFLKQASLRYDRRDVRTLSPAAIECLTAVKWGSAGNLRGLAHCIGGALLMIPRGRHVLTQGDLKLPDHALETTGSSPALDGVSTQGSPGENHPEHHTLIERIHLHGGVISALAEDAEVALTLGYPKLPIPTSTLRLRLKKLGLMGVIEIARQGNRDTVSLPKAIMAIKAAGSGSAAARALGIPRTTLVWKLRAAGLTISEVLDG